MRVLLACSIVLEFIADDVGENHWHQPHLTLSSIASTRLTDIMLDFEPI